MHRKQRLKRLLMLAPLVVVGIVVFIIIGGGMVMLLWNWLLPPLFGWPAITFWQALGLLALCRILFGGFGRHGRSHLRARMHERWESMDPEERERIRQRMRERWGPGSSATGTKER